ncbi:MAG: pyrimidine-nucleoside phosphorylase [Armatimonadota bacterium]|nr:pyrimidine-nucleoside phosphorylase [Armatimonadota bacterium]MDR7445091.1 pyrimidine-nucleoside phosphorylase [Armatimonadota bacterium]MDR7569875.1 pyrimidine-nucleoside phosphorylase [Armatimonadota bacterium]MDR7614176.1 pyrimidine-nucleoside phosphorylase [Armatimonadota bacterium]
MRPYDLIRKKRDGKELTAEELEFLVGGFVRGEVADYQVSAWLMAVYFRGMTDRETADLTLAMARSGRMLDLGGVPGPKVDKHSSGGVGDKTSLVVVPLVASCGVKVPKMSGRGLGHTGGTLDKLESIPGLRTEISVDRFVEQVRRVGCAIVAQSEELVPADKKLYALRDVTATVDSVPLIASSIMSKKLAGGADAIVLDVKTGSGAFMKRVEDALDLARLMVEIGRQLRRRTVAVVSDMDQPLGRAVGNSVEVEEAIGALRGEGPEDLVELCLALGAQMLLLAGQARTEEEGKELLRARLRDGAGLRKLAEMIEAQEGDPAVVDDPRRLPRAPRVVEVLAPESGYVQAMDAEAVGRAAMILGAGRVRKDDRIDHGVGLWVEAKVGARVEAGQPLARLLCRSEETGMEAARHVRTAYRIGPEAPRFRPLVHAVVA